MLRVYTPIMLPTLCLCTNLRRASRGVSRHYDGALEGFGINVAQYSLLCNLKRLDQPSISTLAEAMGLDRSTLGRNLRVLEGEGLVKLAEGADLRNRLVYLTEAGEARLMAALPAWEAAQQRLVERLGEDKRALLVGLLNELAGDH
jgi:DNA-binding MarR family transcriptional regulator